MAERIQVCWANAFRLTPTQAERGGGNGFLLRKFCKDPVGKIYGEAFTGPPGDQVGEI